MSVAGDTNGVIVTVEPGKSGVTYFEDSWVSVWVLNNGLEEVLVDSILLTFEQDSDTTRLEFGGTIGTRGVKPGKSSTPVSVPFNVGLSLKPGTNVLDVRVKYRTLARKDLLLDAASATPKYVIINELPQSGKEVFISHCSPEDTELGKLLQLYLRRAGLLGYLAEMEVGVGLAQMWNEKIEPGILRSSALVPLWTSSVETRQDQVVREIKFAWDHGHPTYPLLEWAPESDHEGKGFYNLFPQTGPEHLKFDRKSPRSGLIAVVDRIYNDLIERRTTAPPR